MAANQCHENTDDDEEIGVNNDDDATDKEGGLWICDDIYIPPPSVRFNQINQCGSPRLIISKIVNRNFKSYAGEVEIGSFHQCFSAIVGPNGSGKSNIIDSMLFVFGYRASKIRSKKISVLIHNSSEHPNVNSCEVAVHFQKIIDTDDGKYDIVPNTEFIISRTAFKDNSSHYGINGRRVQFKEVASVLRSEGIDLDHNRFLILQGEVEQIAMMKAKAQTEHDVGMLEFLEDIIGTSRYKEPLNKLFGMIEQLNDTVVERTNRVRIAEQTRDKLREPMQNAVDYLKLENTITKMKNKLYFCQRHEASEMLKTKEESNSELEADSNKLKEEMVKVSDEKETINKELKEKCKKWDTIQQKKDAATTNFDTLRKRDEALYAEAVATNKRKKENQATIQNEMKKLEELKKVPGKNAKDIEECEALVEKQTVACEKEEEKLEVLKGSVREKTEPLLKERTELEAKFIDLRKNVNEAQASFDIAESKLNLYTSVEKTEKEKLEILQQTLQQSSETLEDRQKKLSVFEKKIPATKKSLDEAKKQLDEINTKESELNNQLRQKRAYFEEQRLAMNANKSRNKVLDALMSEKSQGRIPGIFGRLGNLGAIDAKYDVAISTACGPLDHIVVDNVDTAQACIEFLRANDIGRSTFISLEKQERFIPHCQQRITTPENVPRLFDLIRVEDERVLPAFFYGLQNTLVADNLDQATRIAYGSKRFRVVTLKGELIEMSGTMSGGGKSVARGRMGQKVSRSELAPRDLQKLQGDLDEIFETCNGLKHDKEPLIKQIETLAAGLEEMLVNKEKYAIEIQSLKEQVPLLKSQLESQETKTKAAICNPKETKKLSEAVDVASNKLEKVQDQSKSIEVEINRINKTIDELSSNRVKEQQKIISSIVKSINKAKSEICRLEVAVKTAERNAEKAERHITDLENNIKKCEERLREIKDEKSEVEEKAKELLKELESYTEALVERDEAGATFREKLEALQKRETKMKALNIDLDQKLSDSKKVLSDLSRQVDEYTRRLKSLKLNKIPDEPEEPLPELSVGEIEGLDARTIDANLRAAKERLPKEVPNMQVINDYLAHHDTYLKRVAEAKEITDERNKLRNSYELARKRRLEEFLAGFSEITSKLKDMYQMITLGGAADLELVDSLDPFSEGVVFSVRPPKKSWKNISNLSGGEKTLSSLALVFALHHYKPTPLYFMDEIDAALDFKNVSIVGTYIKERTKNAQFMVISLRSEMFEMANTLVGIYKTHNATKSVTASMKKVHEKNPTIAKLESEREQRRPVSRPNIAHLSQPLQPKETIVPPIVLTCPARISSAPLQTVSSIKQNNIDANNAVQTVNNGDTPAIPSTSTHLTSPPVTPVVKKRKIKE